MSAGSVSPRGGACQNQHTRSQSGFSSEPKKTTIADKIDTHILAKQSEGLSNSTRRKLKYQLGLFERYMSDLSTFFPHEIPTDE